MMLFYISWRKKVVLILGINLEGLGLWLYLVGPLCAGYAKPVRAHIHADWLTDEMPPTRRRG